MGTRPALLALAVAACGHRTAHHDDAAAAAPSPALLTVTLDGETVATLDRAALEARPRLDSLVSDEASWRRVGASDGAGRDFGVADPARTRADLAIVLYLDGDRPAIGFFRAPPAGASDAVRAELAKPRDGLVGIETVTIERKPPAAAPAATLDVTVDGEVRHASLAALAALPQQQAPEGGEKARDRRPGWALADVIAALVPGAKWKTVRLVGDSTVDVAPDATALCRLNRRGELVIDLWPGPTRIRHLQRIELL